MTTEPETREPTKIPASEVAYSAANVVLFAVAALWTWWFLIPAAVCAAATAAAMRQRRAVARRKAQKRSAYSSAGRASKTRNPAGGGAAKRSRNPFKRNKNGQGDKASKKSRNPFKRDKNKNGHAAASGVASKKRRWNKPSTWRNKGDKKSVAAKPSRAERRAAANNRKAGKAKAKADRARSQANRDAAKATKSPSARRRSRAAKSQRKANTAQKKADKATRKATPGKPDTGPASTRPAPGATASKPSTARPAPPRAVAKTRAAARPAQTQTSQPSPSHKGQGFASGGHTMAFGTQFRDAAEAWSAQAKNYDPEKMPEFGHEMHALAEGVNIIGDTLREVTITAGSRWPLHEKVVEFMAAFTAMQKRAGEAAADIVPAFNAVHEQDRQRHEAPRAGEEKWDVK